MTPFSLSELGLSEDEINALGLGEPTTAPEPAATPEPNQPPAEPEMTPFSLSELGLSEDEINALGLGEPAAAPEPTATPEPEMTPFSLSDLGLSEDEINALDLGEASGGADAAPSDLPAEIEEPEQEAQVAPSGAEAVEPAQPAQPTAPAEASEPEPAQPAQPSRPIETPAAAPAAAPQPRTPTPAAGRGDEAPIYTGNDIVDTFLRQLEAEPEDDVLRISLARIGWQIGIPDLAVQQYKYLIKHNRSLDQVVDEINDLLSDSDEEKLMQRLHRVLGDAYTKQGRFREAVNEYSWTLGGPRGAR
jgi:hypothetical protein